MDSRERPQLVIALGEGPEGQKLRESLDAAAKRAGKPTSTWAREVLAATAASMDLSHDPIMEVVVHEVSARKMMTIDLRRIAAVEGGETLGGSGRTNVVRCLIGGTWWEIEAVEPIGFIRRWQRVCRYGVES